MTIPGGEVTHNQNGLSWQLYGGYTDIKASCSTLDMYSVRSLCMSQHIVKLYHDGLITYRENRNWKHIRQKSKHFYVLWFPTRGSVQISQNNQNYELGSDEYAVTYANKPFKIAINASKGQVFEAYLMALPAHQIQDYIPNCELIAGRKFSITGGDIKAAKQTLITLFEEGRNMSADVVSAYMRASLKALSSPMKNECKKTYEASNIRAVRLRSIREVIESNLSNPDLTVAMVARECGISSRYVSYLFKEANLGFNELVWNKRLECAKKWLQGTNHEDMTISSIAYTCGFTSASHFSRSFKARFGLTPSEVRNVQADLASKAA